MKRKYAHLLFTGALAISLVTSSCFNNINEVMAEEVNSKYTDESDKYKSSDCIYLSDIDYIDSSYTSSGVINKDTTINGQKIRLKINDNIVTFDKGVGAHAPSEIVYDVSNYSNVYTKLSMYMGVDYSKNGYGDGVKFTISTSMDGNNWNVVKQTDVLKPSDNAEYVDLNIKGIKYIKLYIDKNRNNLYDHSVYADAKLSKNYNMEAELNQSKGGVMLSTAGLGLRFFASVENVKPNDAASYYITTASNKNETPKFEIKSTVLGGDYSQIKTSLEFSELSKLDENIDTKLYVKRVKKGQEPTYTELTAGNVDFTNAFNISNGEVSVSLSKNKDNSLKLNKITLNENSFSQELSSIDWNSTGMVISGIAILNGVSNDFENATVSMLLKDASGNYIQKSGKNVEIRGVCKGGKYEVTIPYNQLNDAKTFELRLIGSNYQQYGELTKGNVEELKSTINGNMEYILSTDSNDVINLSVSKIGQLSKLSSISVTSNTETGLHQFSIKGNLYGADIDNIKSSIRYTLIAKKGDKALFEKLMTRVKDSKGSYNGFKTNISLKELMDAQLNQNDEVSFVLRVEYLGDVKELDLNSSLESVSITDLSSKETFEIISKDGKAILIKK